MERKIDTLESVWMRLGGPRSESRSFPRNEAARAYADGWRIDLHGYLSNRWGRASIDSLDTAIADEARALAVA